MVGSRAGGNGERRKWRVDYIKDWENAKRPATCKFPDLMMCFIGKPVSRLLSRATRGTLPCFSGPHSKTKANWNRNGMLVSIYQICKGKNDRYFIILAKGRGIGTLTLLAGAKIGRKCLCWRTIWEYPSKLNIYILWFSTFASKNLFILGC